MWIYGEGIMFIPSNNDRKEKGVHKGLANLSSLCVLLLWPSSISTGDSGIAQGLCPGYYSQKFLALQLRSVRKSDEYS